jgi:hypothetical protein
MVMGCFWFLAACSASNPVQASKGTETDVVTETVCQLYASRFTPEKKQIHIHATAWVALLHGGSLLQDASCPKVAIGFRFADDARDRPMVKKLNEAMIGDVMDLKPRVFDVQMTGVLSGATKAEPGGLFVVDDVEGFKQRK